MGHAHSVLQRETLHAGQRLQAELLPAVQPELQGDVRREKNCDTCAAEKRTGEDASDELSASRYKLGLDVN